MVGSRSILIILIQRIHLPNVAGLAAETMPLQWLWEPDTSKIASVDPWGSETTEASGDPCDSKRIS